MNIQIFFLFGFVIVHCSDNTCSKDDIECHNSQLNSFINVDEEILNVRELEKVSLNKAYEEIKSVYKSHPENANVLFLFAKIQWKLYSKLHVKMRDVGKIELLEPSIDHLKKILMMPKEQVSDEFHAEVSEYASDSALASSNKTLSVELLEAVLVRKGNPAINEDKYKEYFNLLAEELFFAKQYEKCIQLIGTIRQMFPGRNLNLGFIHALIARYNEVANKQPFIISHDLLKKIKIKTDDDKREVIESVKELEAELRRQKRSVEVDVLFELSEELELFPSKYQRPDMLLSGLKAQPLWTIEESGFGEELNKVVEDWKMVRKEFMNMTEELEDWEWKASPKFDNYDYYYFIGDGVTELPVHGCDIAPTFCDIIKHFSILNDCVLCEIKLIYFEPKGHVRPFVGSTNAKLTALFPVNLGNGTLNEHGHSAFTVRVGDQKVTWIENQPTIIDGSFEHEIVSNVLSGRLMLMIDFKHPDLTSDDDFLDPKFWDILQVDGGQFIYQMKEDMMSL